ncbi:MAG: gliding motility-associated C-terminal domain-containing protein [Bacteroidales bacterium]|nr:gliding motility-associated C-terminal domain-containing protein [Bacteroidales bacterium]
MKHLFIFIFSVLIATLLLISENTYACTGSTLAGSITPNNNWQTLAGVQAGDRYTFTIVAGEVIIFSFCQGGGTYSNDPRIDLHNQDGTITYDFNDDHCGYGAELVWVCPTSGTYSIGLYEFSCLTNGTALGTIAYKYLPTPTEQDCLGARPLCNSFSNHPQSYVGTGHYYDIFNFYEQYGMSANVNNCPNCLVTGERNNVWYTFTAQTSGNLAFTITPVNLSDDYDWALYSLNSGVTCLDLINWQAHPPVSCNFSFAGNGITGLGSGSSHCIGPVENNLFNAPLSINAGETYVLTVSNFSSTQNGYSINFGASTATIVDNSSPEMESLVYDPYCGSSSLTVQFSEAIWCSSVQPADFVLTGPAGTYSIDETYSIVCTSASSNTYAGTWYDDVWTLQLGDLLSQSGDYVLTLIDGSVEDKCNNVNEENQLFFTVVGVTADIDITAASGCGGGDCNGEIIVSNITGGTPPYFVDWSGPAGFTSNALTISSLCNGVYGLTITDSEGICEFIDSVQMLGSPPLNSTATSNSPVCAGGTIELLADCDDGTATYSWTGPSTFTSSQQNPTRPNANIGMSGTYMLTVTDAAGCTETVSTDVTINAVTPVSISADSPYCEGENIQLNATSVVGASYSWTGPGFFSSINEDPLISNCVTTDAGTYSVVVTDANSCTVSASIAIVVNEGIIADIVTTNPLCYQEPTGQIQVNVTSGTAPYNFIWTNGSTSNLATGLIGGIPICVTITDAGSCNLVICHTLTNPPEIVVDITTVPTECGFFDGEIITNVSGGAGGYTINISEGHSGNHVTGLHPGDYQVTVTDANNCSVVSTATVGFFGAGTVDIVQIQEVFCFGQNTAVLQANMLNGSIPYTYNWSVPGQTTQNLSGIGAGTYSVSVSDSYGCSGVATYEVIQPEIMTINIEHTNVLCRGENNGSALINAVGGTPPYVYAWNHGPTSNSLSNLSAGTYSVVVQDFNACSVNEVVVITQPDNIVGLSVTISDVSCFGRYDGMAIATGTGGTPPYSIHWFQFNEFIASGTQISSLSAGQYSAQVYDANNCVKEALFSISEPSALIVETQVSGVSCKGFNDGSVIVAVEGGTLPYSFEWNSGETISSISSLKAGNYYITITDANGCIKALGVNVQGSNKLCLGIPNAFTPNGDGINDTWEIDYIEMYPSAYVNVFNRWGQHIYQAKSNEDFWDGKWKGKYVPAGSYQYVIDLRNGMEPFTGVVVVVY